MQDMQTNDPTDSNIAVAEMQDDTAVIAPSSEPMGESAIASRGTDQPLSQREKQVVRMIGGGKTVGQIAVELNLSVKTVSTYRVRALHKLGMTTNADLMRYAIQHKLEDSAAENTTAEVESDAVDNTESGIDFQTANNSLSATPEPATEEQTERGNQ